MSCKKPLTREDVTHNMPSSASTTPTPLLSVKNLTVFARTQTVPKPLLQDLHFDIYPGESLGLIGESGAGKSLTVLSLLQLLPPGLSLSPHTQIFVNGKSIYPSTFARLRHIRRHDLAMVFQDPSVSLNPVLTIDTQLQEVLPPKTSLAQRCACLEQVALPDPKRVLNAYPFELSGGMQQRVLIAMALAKKTRLLILDEPTTGLDVITQASLLELLQQLQAQGLTFLVISHDTKVVKALTRQQIGLANGKQVTLDTSKTLPALPLLSPSLPKPVLRVNNLDFQLPIKRGFFRRTVGEHRILENINFTLHERETLAIVGESGAGKTSLAKLLVGLQQPSAGEIHYLQPLQRQIIFQNAFASLNPRLSVQETLVEAFQSPLVSPDTTLNNQQRCLALLEQVHLPNHFLSRYPHELSGGQRKRLTIARALATKSRLLICDEPTSNLDERHEHQILQLLLDLQQDLDLSYLLITHDLAVAKALSHQVFMRWV